MEIQLINEEFLDDLQEKAKGNERLRINFDLRTSAEDTSQRMLNALQPGTKMPIHRHMKSSETVVCLEGCLDWIFYEEMPNEQLRVESLEFLDEPSGKAERREPASPNMKFKEVARFRVCPRENLYGIQVPKMAWHSIVVHEPSVIFEAKDGAYAPLGPEEVRGK